MIRCFTLLTVFFLVIAASALQAQPAQQKPSFPSGENAKVTFQVFNGENGTFGYDIFHEGKKLIHQPTIPGQPGNQGFKTKADAEKVAELVIKKIKKGESPPSVTTDELKKLSII